MPNCPPWSHLVRIRELFLYLSDIAPASFFLSPFISGSAFSVRSFSDFEKLFRDGDVCRSSGWKIKSFPFSKNTFLCCSRSWLNIQRKEVGSVPFEARRTGWISVRPTAFKRVEGKKMFRVCADFCGVNVGIFSAKAFSKRVCIYLLWQWTANLVGSRSQGNTSENCHFQRGCNSILSGFLSVCRTFSSSHPKSVREATAIASSQLDFRSFRVRIRIESNRNEATDVRCVLNYDCDHR